MSACVPDMASLALSHMMYALEPTKPDIRQQRVRWALLRGTVCSWGSRGAVCTSQSLCGPFFMLLYTKPIPLGEAGKGCFLGLQQTARVHP